MKRFVTLLIILSAILLACTNNKIQQTDAGVTMAGTAGLDSNAGAAGVMPGAGAAGVMSGGIAGTAGAAVGTTAGESGIVITTN